MIRRSKPVSQAVSDVLIVASLTVGVLLVSTTFDLFEKFLLLMQSFEHLELDELFITVFVFCLGAIWYAYRRLKESGKANGQLRRNLGQMQIMGLAIEVMEEAVIITDPSGLIEHVNPACCRINGYLDEDIVGQPISLLRYGSHQADLYQQLWSCVSAGGLWQGKLQNRRSCGQAYTAMVSIAPIHDDIGNIQHYVTVQQDLSEYEAMELRFQQSQKMEAIGTLVGGMAHDFNNMLSGMVSHLYLAKRKINTDQNAAEHLDSIDQLVSKSADIIRQLMTFARKDKVEMVDVKACKLFSDIFQLAQSAIPENIAVRTDCQVNQSYIHANATQLQQIVMNLMNNAKDALHSVSDPVIRCSLVLFEADELFRKAHPELKADQFVRFSISDNGCGIEAEKLTQIFDPFFTTKEVGKGTGLGLAMVYGAVQSHGGLIQAESKLGIGTEFSIYLPIVNHHSKAESEAVETIFHGSGETVLYVEDDAFLREINAPLLKSLDYQVLVATDGEMALQLFAEHKERIDLVLMDMIMPKLGGVDTAKQMELIKPDILIVFVTGYDRDQISELRKHAQFKYPVLRKPLEVDALSLTLRESFSAL